MKEHRKLALPYKFISALVLLFPRFALVYPLYAMAAFMLALDARNKGRGIVIAAVLLLYCSVQLTVLSLSYDVSYVNMLLDYVQILPLFLIMFVPMYSWAQDTHLIIHLNYAVFVLSIANMTINFGFPMQLPYINFLPDAISAFWGNGGVKITTLCGFMGILSLMRHPTDRNYIAWAIVVFNFILPSYNIGIACGLAAFGYLFVRTLSFRTLIQTGLVGMVFVATVVPYVIERLDLLNSMFADEFGMHPKLYALYLYIKLASTDLGVFLFGGGLGNISGTAALWANESLNQISSNSPMSIPGMFESELHIKTVGGALSIIDTQPYAVQSSMNKPYFTVVTLLFEFGLIASALILFRFFYCLLNGGLDPTYAKALVIFIICIFMIDNLHANPLFWGVLVIGIRALIGSPKIIDTNAVKAKKSY